MSALRLWRCCCAVCRTRHTSPPSYSQRRAYPLTLPMEVSLCSIVKIRSTLPRPVLKVQDSQGFHRRHDGSTTYLMIAKYASCDRWRLYCLFLGALTYHAIPWTTLSAVTNTDHSRDLIAWRYPSCTPKETGLHTIALVTRLSLVPSLIPILVPFTAANNSPTSNDNPRHPIHSSYNAAALLERCSCELLTNERHSYLLGTGNRTIQAAEPRRAAHEAFSHNMRKLHKRHIALLHKAHFLERDLWHSRSASIRAVQKAIEGEISQAYSEAVALVCVFHWATARRFPLVASWV